MKYVKHDLKRFARSLFHEKKTVEKSNKKQLFCALKNSMSFMPAIKIVKSPGRFTLYSTELWVNLENAEKIHDPTVGPLY